MMKDIQNEQADVQIPIDKVGVRNIRLPIVVSDRVNCKQHTVATVEIGVDLPSHFKGTHMSRFLAVLESWAEDLCYESVKSLLESIKTRLHAQKAHVCFKFPYFIRKAAPVSGASCLQGYDCKLTGEIDDLGKIHFLLDVVVPVMTVCPCSKAISDEGAHSQRADVRIALHLRAFNWLEEFIDIAEKAASSPTYPLVKREDEKYMTEQAFASPRFVEDVVRNVAVVLSGHSQVQWYRVEVESYESIHSHNAFAIIEGSNGNWAS